jgi:hypothetical protein
VISLICPEVSGVQPLARSWVSRRSCGKPVGGARIGAEPSPTQVDVFRSCRLRRRATRATGGSLARLASIHRHRVGIANFTRGRQRKLSLNGSHQNCGHTKGRR